MTSVYVLLVAVLPNVWDGAKFEFVPVNAEQVFASETSCRAAAERYVSVKKIKDSWDRTRRLTASCVRLNTGVLAK